MRINCDVTAVNRTPAAARCRPPRAARASLGLGRADDASVCLHLCTATNKHGNKYKVMKNIDGVFAKFVSEGKFTIRLKEPPLDLIVKTDAVQAKSFLQLLRSCLRGSVPVLLPPLVPVKAAQLVRPKLSLVVTSRQDYPVSSNFPPSLLYISVTGCQLSRVDGRILRLRRLQALDLAQNNITQLPPGISNMAALTDLCLADNALARLPPHIFAGSIGASLRKLDLNGNQLELLPASLCLLRALVTLDVSKNKLQKLPLSLCRLRQLTCLTVSSNALRSLPVKLSGTRLSLLDINCLRVDGTDCLPDDVNLPAVLPLHELAARALLTSCGEDLSCLAALPTTLHHRLSYHVLCTRCGSPIVQYSAVTERHTGGWDKMFSGIGVSSCGWSIRGVQVSCSQPCYAAVRAAAS